MIIKILIDIIKSRGLEIKALAQFKLGQQNLSSIGDYRNVKVYIVLSIKRKIIGSYLFSHFQIFHYLAFSLFFTNN